MKENTEAAVEDIISICEPLRIILYAEKRTMSTGKLKSISLCVVVPDGADCRALRTKLYLVIQGNLPVSLSVYQKSEWDELLTHSDSYASWISQKGQVVYEPQT